MRQYNKAQVSMVLAVACCLLSSAVSVYADSAPPVKFTIGLSGNRAGQNNEYYQGEPIGGHVRMWRESKGGEVEGGVLRLGTASLPWVKSLSFDVFSVGQSPTQSISETTQRKVPLKTVKAEVMDIGTSSREYELSTNQVQELSAIWVISYTITSNLPPGRYVVQAAFDTTDKSDAYPEMLHIRLMSREVPFVLKERPSDGRADVDILRARARHFGFMGQHDEVIAVLEQAMRLDPARQESHSLIGEACERKRDFNAAIREYRRYVEWVRQQPNIAKAFRIHADEIEKRAQTLEARIQNLNQSKP